MLRFLTDEDFNGRIVRGLFRRKQEVDLVRVQDVGLQGASDELLLEWAEDHARILVTHDARTMPGHALDRLASGSVCPGMFVVDDLAPIGVCIEDLLLVEECSDPSEWLNRIVYLPFVRG
ncbi:DUF5615 family PIN-like protein [Bythopirellula polymerisocia]|uniref:DUF5615 domain-containing protein n=1 Tax=Bythopirellula polymerisocia TaxID=2528003 RepID=A0A5C6CQB0_9BACT|nr:DUF5615 family PIN-like protein [Bythopirellula polymerisocia]TWU25807.1 hypothetical protein Pla144_30190 [Bythopirellula polymerisocia]